ESHFPEGRWRKPIWLDAPARDALVARTPEGRARARTASDITWHPVQYYTVVVDSILVPLAFDRFNTDVAWQMSMINWQAIGTAFFVTRGLHLLVGRSRPSVHACLAEPDYSNGKCEPAGPSFPAGHTSMAATGAAL